MEDLQDVQGINTVEGVLSILDQGIHPGAVLNRLLKLKAIRESELADEIGLSRAMISQIVSNGKRVTPETALLLSAFFLRRDVTTTAEDWATAQLKIDLEQAVTKGITRRLQNNEPVAA